MTATTLTDIYSYSNTKKLYAPKGAKVEVQEYGRSTFKERLFLCEYRGLKFITKEQNLKVNANES